MQMVKWIGYLLILAACFGISEQAVKRLKDRRETLKKLKVWLSHFRGKVLYENATLEEALRESAAKAGPECAPFFLSVAEALEERSGMRFSEIWEKKSEYLRKCTALSGEELGEINRFGVGLGELDVKVQERAILRYDDELTVAFNGVTGELEKKERLYRSLGVLAGCFIIIVLW